VIHLANLFPAKKGLVTAIITGCFQLSFCIFFIFDQLWFFGGVDYRTIFMSHAGVCLVCLAASVLLWPDKPFQFDEQVSPADDRNYTQTLTSVAIQGASSQPKHAAGAHRCGRGLLGGRHASGRPSPAAGPHPLPLYVPARRL
jgi:hypothetical protein